MITPEQQQWLDHLSVTDQVVIVPWDRTARDKYQIIKEQIHKFLGKEYKIEHRGATSLKISGQNEIDIYVPVKTDQFEKTVEKISELYGQARSHYPLKRARFVSSVEGKHIDIFVINAEDQAWIDSEIFHNYLLNHADALEEYRILKESLSGQSTKTYYTAKTEFINQILSTVKMS